MLIIMVELRRDILFGRDAIEGSDGCRVEEAEAN